MTTYERLRRRVAETWSIEEASLTPQSSFAGGGPGARPPAPPASPDGPGSFGDLPDDSLEMVELMMALEEEFQLELPDDEIERVANVTLEELAEEIDRRRERNGSASSEGSE